MTQEYVVLKVPTQSAGCPFIQCTHAGIISQIILTLSVEGFPSVSTRNEIMIEDRLVSCELHRLENRDGEVGMRILNILQQMGFEIVRCEVLQSEHGYEMVSTVYNLERRS